MIIYNKVYGYDLHSLFAIRLSKANKSADICLVNQKLMVGECYHAKFEISAKSDDSALSTCNFTCSWYTPLPASYEFCIVADVHIISKWHLLECCFHSYTALKLIAMIADYICLSSIFNISLVSANAISYFIILQYEILIAHL